jgi:hypothetical protein
VLRSIGKGTGEIFFWATYSGAELDMFWQQAGKNWGVEYKYSDAPGLSTSMKIACRDLALEHLWVVYPGSKSYNLTKQISVLPIREIAFPWKY